MRISDWSSDFCSSDLGEDDGALAGRLQRLKASNHAGIDRAAVVQHAELVEQEGVVAGGEGRQAGDQRGFRHAPEAARPWRPAASNVRVWRTMIASSSVGTTRRARRLPALLMRGPPAALAPSSSPAPSQARRGATAGRT